MMSDSKTPSASTDPDRPSDSAFRTPHSALDRVYRAIDAEQGRFVADLQRLVRQPSISSQNVGVRECAALEADLLRQAGLSTREIATAGHPMVYGEWLGAPGKPTVLFYGHYDVQPPDPLDLWTTPPFEPAIRDGRIYARGIADNKAQHFSHIAAIRSWLETTGSLPVNVKVLLEGEEETGSPHLESTVLAHRDLLAAVTLADLGYESLDHLPDVCRQVSDALPPER